MQRRCSPEQRASAFPTFSATNNFPLRKNSAGINAVVVLLINAENVAINDLYGLIYPVKEAVIRADDLIHLNERGIELCSDQVYKAIKKHL